jgi:queuosine precursor transporter
MKFPTVINKLDFLLGLYLTAIMAAELMGGKIFTMFGVNASVAIFAFPITFTINDIVAEVHGKQRAVSFIRTASMMLVVLFVFSLLATSLPPASRFTLNDAYGEIFAKSQRIILASLSAFWIAERFDVYVYQRILTRFGKGRLWLRNNLSNFISQLFDTTIFMFLAFYNPGNELFLLSLIWPYWLLKCGVSIMETPFTYWGVKWLRTK